MMRSALFSSTTGETLFGGEELLDTWSLSSEDWLWLDIEAEGDDEITALLQSRFDTSKLAITDAYRVRHPPKIEVFDTNTFLLIRGLDARTTNMDYKTIQISFFLGQNFLVTYRFNKSLSIDRTWKSLEDGVISQARGPVYITCKVLRAIVDRYTPILLNLEQRLEEMESELFQIRDDRLLEELVRYNSDLKRMRRTLTYHCNAIGEFEELDYIQNKKDDYHRVHDVYEQFDRLNTLSVLYQELVVDLMNGYLSLSSHRLNQIMKVLTVFTVIFLPLTLMVGIYGMNFEYMPELRWRFGYFAALGTMATIVIVAVSILKWKKWL